MINNDRELEITQDRIRQFERQVAQISKVSRLSATVMGSAPALAEHPESYHSVSYALREASSPRSP